MLERTLKALVESDPENSDSIVLLSPAVGLFRPHLPKGAYVTPDLSLGIFSSLQRFYRLLAPQGARGAVLQQLVDDGVNRVQYRTPLLRVGAATAEQIEAATAASGEAASTASDSEAADMLVRSPTHGVFYRRPDPRSPAYVNVGDIVEPGAQLALVEVMKCFNQIRLDGDGLPDRSEVVRIPVEDASEVALGQVLFVLKAL
jgi:acetyl-CoA carboxylase biotin carboxyl carrier protein